jgi:hypothetical protein
MIAAIVCLFGTVCAVGKIYVSSHVNPIGCQKVRKNGNVYTFPHRPGGNTVTERHAFVMTEWRLFCLTAG